MTSLLQDLTNMFGFFIFFYTVFIGICRWDTETLWEAAKLALFPASIMTLLIGVI